MDYGVVLIMAGQSNHSNSGRRLMQPAEVWVSLWQSRGASKGEHSPAGLQAACGIRRVKKTGRNRSGNRSYRSNRPGPVPVPAGFKPAQIQILNLNSKKWKNPQKNLKNTSSWDEFNDVKFFQIFVHLVYFASI